MTDEIKPQNNIWKTIAIGLAIIFCLSISFLILRYESAKTYNSGISFGSNATLESIAKGQTQSGNIVVMNGTQITIIPIQTICKNIGGAK